MERFPMKIDMLNSKGCFLFFFFPFLFLLLVKREKKKKELKTSIFVLLLARQNDFHSFHSAPSEIPGRFVYMWQLCLLPVAMSYIIKIILVNEGTSLPLDKRKPNLFSVCHKICSGHQRHFLCWGEWCPHLPNRNDTVPVRIVLSTSSTFC